MEKNITVYQNKKVKYPTKNYLFRPSVVYPEYPFKEEISVEYNGTYEMVREALHLAGYDEKKYGMPTWNPLGQIISKGNIVVIKPNLVLDVNRSGDSEDCLYTHPSVVAAVVDYVIIALKNTGKIIIGDAPMQECNFECLIKNSGYKDLVDYYKSKGTNIQLVDFRELKSCVENGIRHNIINSNASGKIIDLKDESEFNIYNEKHLQSMRITNYDPSILNSHHTLGKHEYFISNYVLDADVLINMPKPKTHRKAGVTISLKNLVGINVRKEFLPHHSNGDMNSGGDEYQNKSSLKEIEAFLLDKINTATANKKYNQVRFFKLIKKLNSQFIKFNPDKFREGSWYGNNTISKTIADLNKILLYADKNGFMCDKRQRKMLIVADLIVAGEKEGPVLPSRKDVGVIAIGEDAVCFDETIATLMGMDISKIPTLCQVRNITGNRPIIENGSVAIIRSNNDKWDGKHIEEIAAEDTWHFTPTSGWIGHIEL